MASRHLPILIATGARTWTMCAARSLRRVRTRSEFLLMQCNTNYTGSLENFSQIALNVLKVYAREFPDVVLGISDHTPGSAVVLGAVTLGALWSEALYGRQGPRGSRSRLFHEPDRLARHGRPDPRTRKRRLGTENRCDEERRRNHGAAAPRDPCRAADRQGQTYRGLRSYSAAAMPARRAAAIPDQQCGRTKRDTGLPEGECVGAPTSSKDA